MAGLLLLLLAAGAPVDVRDSEGRTALHRAAEHNDANAAKSLLAKGADPKVKDSEGNTPASLAEGPAVRAMFK